MEAKMSQAKSHELAFCADAKTWMEKRIEKRDIVDRKKGHRGYFLTLKVGK
jgi:hypothetical protein